MAWITVDQKLIGGKLREFAKCAGCSQNEAIGILIRLWLWGIDNAEEDGTIVAGEKSDVEEAIRPGFSEEDRWKVADVVQSLIDCHWVDEIDGVLYLHDWMDWRTYYNNYVSGKEKHAAQMREYRRNKKCEENADSTGEPPKEEKKANPYTEGFEAFWEAYPRKIDKGNAYKKYQARLKDGFSEAELLEASRNYAAQCKRERTEQKYIKHGKTFLSDSMPFQDYIHRNNQEPQKNASRGDNPFK